MALSSSTSTPKPSTSTQRGQGAGAGPDPILAVIADFNLHDPRPATMRELLGCDFVLHRVTDLPSFLKFTAFPGTLKYIMVACLSPLIAEFTEIEDSDDREIALGR